MKTRVLIVDDQRMVCESLADFINQHSDYEVIAISYDGRTGIDKCVELKPDIVLMDIGMDELNGIDATRQLKSKVPRAKVLALSVHVSAYYLRKMLAAGASGYLPKNSSLDELFDALGTIASGRTYISPRLKTLTTEDSSRDCRVLLPLREILTERQREILQLKVEGNSPAEIASKLSITQKTVEKHYAEIKKKSGMNNLALLTKYAIQEGLTALDESLLKDH